MKKCFVCTLLSFKRVNELISFLIGKEFKQNTKKIWKIKFISQIALIIRALTYKITEKILWIFKFQSVYPLHFGDTDGNYVTQYYCNDYDDRMSLVYTIYQVSIIYYNLKYNHLFTKIRRNFKISIFLSFHYKFYFSVSCLLCVTCSTHDCLLFCSDQRALEVKQKYEHTCQCKFLNQKI